MHKNWYRSPFRQHYLQMGNQRKPNCLLMEVCKIIEGQRYSKRLNERQIIALPKGYLLSSSYISMHGETMTPWKYTAKGKNLFLRHEDQRNFGLEQLADRNLISFYERSNIPDGAHGYPGMRGQLLSNLPRCTVLYLSTPTTLPSLLCLPNMCS